MKRRYCVAKNVWAEKAVKAVLVLLFSASVAWGQNNNPFSNFPLFSVERYATTSGNNHIAVFNIDNKPPYDLIFYGNGGNEFTYHSYARLSRIKRKFFFFPISEIKQIRYSKLADKRLYIFTSREKNLIGVASFTEYGTLRLLNKRVLPDYPEKILVGNFLGAPSLRALVFGSSFTGVSLFSLDNFKLKETKVLKNGSFSEGGLLDMDADGMNDLVLFDALKQKSDFYLNLLNRFEITFSEKSLNNIRNLKTSDINGDKLIDYAYLSDGKIIANIVRSNPKDREITEFTAPDCKDYEFTDFSFDFKKDLIWVNKEGDIFYRIKSKKDKFFPERFLKRTENASAISTVWNKNRREIIILSENGFFEKLSPVNKIDTTFSLLLPDLKRESAPKILRTKNGIKIAWLAESFPLVYYVNVFSSGKIKKGTETIPFAPDDLILLKNGNLYASHGDSLTLFIENKNGGEILFSASPKDYEIRNGVFLLGEKDKPLLPDSVETEFEYEKFIARRGADFVFRDSANLIFAAPKKNKLKAVKKTEYESSFSFAPVFGKTEAVIAAVKDGTVKFIGEKNELEFKCNRKFKRKNDYEFFVSGNDAIYLRDAARGNIYKARLNKNGYIRFTKILSNLNLEEPVIFSAKDKVFVAGFNGKLRTLDFIQLR